jgi:hypothetical protein
VRTVPWRPYRLEFSDGDDGNGCVASMAVQAYIMIGSVRMPYQWQGKGRFTRGVLEDREPDSRGFRKHVLHHALCGPVIVDNENRYYPHY